MDVRQQLVSARNKTYGEGNTAEFITVHETGNRAVGAGAQAHANLQSRGNVRNASWHWQVDDKVCIQSFIHTVMCWHAGDGKGPGAKRSIAIEICVNADSDMAKAYDNAARLVASIMRAGRPIPLSHVVQHNKWSGKNCPTGLRTGAYGQTWDRFIGAVSQYVGIPAPAPAPPIVLPPTIPKGPALLRVDGDWGGKTTGAIQYLLGTPQDEVISNQLLRWKSRNPALSTGWDWSGRVGDGGSTVMRALQVKVGATPDGYGGPETFRKIQQWVGTFADGFFTGPPSPAIVRLQEHINRVLQGAGAF